MIFSLVLHLFICKICAQSPIIFVSNFYPSLISLMSIFFSHRVLEFFHNFKQYVDVVLISLWKYLHLKYSTISRPKYILILWVNFLVKKVQTLLVIIRKISDLSITCSPLWGNLKAWIKIFFMFLSFQCITVRRQFDLDLGSILDNFFSCSGLVLVWNLCPVSYYIH